MQIAEILSDLDTLRVCDAPAALALVSASTTTTYPFPATSTSTTAAASDTKPPSSDTPQQAPATDDDVDLMRAKDLIALHELFKGDAGAGKIAGLREARGAVERAVRGL
ncbi:hypothetical protein IWZ01DRAFT_96431 [Phyllosticta capitalensis]